ncbi:MAG: GEVED domain-containing protein [Saprospiraceae bacterium]
MSKSQIADSALSMSPSITRFYFKASFFFILSFCGSLVSIHAQTAITGTPWINEIHYDNASSDVNEGVEIAGLAGLDLAAYELVFYNGSNGTQYDTETLSGILPDEGAGGGALNFLNAGIQNGGPDGIALIEVATGIVVQFLSYEGAFAATNGPASGMMSTDIGVSETGATAVDNSLQLIGTGSTYSDFTWQAPAMHSRDALNQGQTFLIPLNNLPPTSTCANPIIVNDPNQPPVNTPSGGWGPIPANGMLGLLLGFPGGTSATVDLNCLADDNDPVGALEIRLASSTILPGSPYVLENVYDIRDADGAESLELITVQLTAAPIMNQPPMAGAPRVNVELPTSGGADCPAATIVSASIGDEFLVGDAITIAGIGVPVPTAAEISDDIDPDSDLIINVTDLVVTIDACTTTVAITYRVEDTGGLMSDPRTDTFLVIDNEAPVVTCSEFSMPFNRCPDPLGPNSPDGVWRPLPASGVVQSAAGGSSIQSLDFGSCVSDNCNSLEYRISASFEENRVPGCSLDIVNEYEFRDECGNVSPDRVNARFVFTDNSAPIVTCTDFSETFTACPDGLGANTPSGTAQPLPASGMFSTTIGGVYTATLDLSSCISVSCGSLASVQLELIASSVESSTPGCAITIVNEYQVQSACGAVAANTVTFRGTVMLDPAGPTITAPGPVTIDCTDDETDLTITGMASAGDACNPAGPSMPMPTALPVFINEIHYDNAGGDVGEGVEVAGPAGTNLAGYTLSPYNGNGGGEYNVQMLSGTIPDEGGGFGAVWFPIGGLQNGAPDGVALCGPGGVLEFWNYESSPFAASNGCAAGTTSVGVGVSETSGTPVGQSLQRIGSGSMTSAFTWTGPVAASPGSLNAGQTIMAGSTGGGGGMGLPSTFADVVTPTACAGNYTILRTFTVADGCGTTATASQLITVQDIVGPTFTTPAGSLDAAFAKTALMSVSTGPCADDIDLAALAAAATASANGGPAFVLGALPVATDACSSTPISYTATASFGAASSACEAIVELEITATDACGNDGLVPFTVTYTITGSGAATLPLAPAAVMAMTSAGANCLMPFGTLAPGAMFAPGATVMIAGQPVVLPTATEIMGCVGANPMFVVTAVTATPSADPCITDLTVDFEFNSDCGAAAPLPFTLTAELIDDTAPVVVAPSNIMITCLDDPNDVLLTGEATATDNCTPLPIVPLTAAGQIFINEFHYDNVGGDVGEFVEIAGPAGTNLTGYTIELMNGNGGGVYNTNPLSGIIPDEGAGFGALAFMYPSNGLQNGGPDGIALCGPSGIIEFLSYEGAFTATGGCASGIMSTDVGVAESFPTGGVIGSSLQRTGSGTNGGDFIFVGPTTESPGLLNSGQVFQTGGPTGPTGGMIAVSFTDNVIPGACAAEFSIQRTWEAVDACGNIGSALQIITVTDPTPPVFDQAPGALDNTITTTELAAAGLGSCAVQVDLSTLPLSLNFAIAFGQTSFAGIFDLPTATDDCATVILQATNVALVNVTGMAPCSAGIEITYTATNDCGRMSEYKTTLTIVDDEAPVIDPGFNMALTIECDMPFDTATTGQPTFTDNCGTSMAPTSALWINEFHYDNNGGDLNEFVEVAGTAGINLAGYSLEFYNGNGGSVYRTTLLTGVLPDEGQGGGAISVTLPSNGIQNGSPDGIALIDPAGMVVEFISYEGVMTASNGAAAGMTSTDVGVTENGSTLSTESLQRVGAGSMASSFVFTGPAASSPGMLNVNQVYLSSQTVTVTFNEDAVPDPTCPNGQTITREWTADDGCGNVTVATQIVTVVDLEAPEYASFPSDTTVECSSLGGSINMQTQVSTVADALPFPVITDNCTTGLVATFTDVFTLTGPCPTVSVFERIFDAVDDGCGNILPSRTLTVTVIDTLAPVFTSIPLGGDFDCADGVPPTGSVTVSDCDPNVVISEVDDVTIVGVNQVVSITERTITATDACGNESMQIETYRLLDLVGPFLISCPDNVGPIVARPDDMASVQFATPVFDDNCSFSVSGTATSGQDFPVGITTVTFTAIDGGGNVTICEFEIEVVKALNLTCLDQDISIDDAGDQTRADINFPYAATTCESCPQGEPLPSLEYLGYFRGHRYYVSAAGDTRSWTEAQRHAVSLGGRLVEVNSLEENRFLQRELPYSDALIGHYTGPNTTGWTGTFSPVIFENWAAGFPTSGTNEFFALLDASSGTHSNVNHNEKPYIVEFPCVEIEVIDMPSDSLFDQGTNCVVYAAVDLCGNRDTCHYTFGVNTFDVLYCTPTGEAFGGEEEYYITGVSMNAFAKTFDASSLYFHTRDTIELDEDNANSFSFSAETSGMEGGSFYAYWRVWVDANRDGDFYDAGEMIHQAYGDASVTGTLDLPSVLQTISPTRIRVAFSRYAYPEACGDNPFGDIKDFSLISDNPRSPRLVLTGARGVGQHLLTTSSEEDPEIASYLMLRGVSPDDLSKIDLWDALYGDGNRHDYDLMDTDPALSAYYQAVALDDQGYMVRTSNIVHLTMPVRRGPVKAYPNPARDAVYIDLGPQLADPTAPAKPTVGGKLDLYDALGRVVVTQAIPEGATKVRMNLPALATGTYLLRISQPDAEPQTIRVTIDQSGEKVIPRA